MENISVWNPQKCSCQVLIVWFLITDVWSPESRYGTLSLLGIWNAHYTPDDASGSVLTEQCAGLWWVTWARHWPLIGRYCDGSCLHLGQRWKWWAWKMFGWKIFMNTWLWRHGGRSVNLILIQFPGPGYLLYVPGSDGSPLLAAPDTNHFN